MPACRIDDAASPTYARLVKKLKKKFPHIAADAAAAFAQIEADYSTACHANAIPGYSQTVWKYRDFRAETRRAVREAAFA